eukprot:TRINITY_DN1961_c0_g1_i1.p1 TRINITY_DN1961_c0_g1~~TRINITY_DN1961_c0_g1_i1.p1  ORF type:complete len:124 (+),score=22.42 TRINITY_DN1961_c0_g1_i1:452-823(+)
MPTAVDNIYTLNTTNKGDGWSIITTSVSYQNPGLPTGAAIAVLDSQYQYCFSLGHYLLNGPRERTASSWCLPWQKLVSKDYPRSIFHIDGSFLFGVDYYITAIVGPIPDNTTSAVRYDTRLLG